MKIALLTGERHLTVEVLAPTMVPNPHFPGQETPDWDDPTVTATVAGVLQPVNEETATRMGLASRTDVRTLYADAVPLDPEGRVRVGGSVWRVMEVQHHATHTEAVIERLADGS